MVNTEDNSIASSTETEPAAPKKRGRLFGGRAAASPDAPAAGTSADATVVDATGVETGADAPVAKAPRKRATAAKSATDHVNAESAGVGVARAGRRRWAGGSHRCAAHSQKRPSRTSRPLPRARRPPPSLPRGHRRRFAPPRPRSCSRRRISRRSRRCRGRTRSARTARVASPRTPTPSSIRPGFAAVRAAGRARSPREGDNQPGVVVKVRQPAQDPGAHHRAAARQGLDPPRGQEAASPAMVVMPVVGDPSSPRRSSLPVARASTGSWSCAAARPHPDRCARRRRAGRALRREGRGGEPHRQRLPRPGAERAAQHGGRIRRHRPRSQRRALLWRGRLGGRGGRERGRQEPAASHRARAQARRPRARPGHQGSGRPQGRPSHEPGEPARPLPRLRAQRLDERHQPQAARHRARAAQDHPQAGPARERRRHRAHGSRGAPPRNSSPSTSTG